MDFGGVGHRGFDFVTLDGAESFFGDFGGLFVGCGGFAGGDVGHGSLCGRGAFEIVGCGFGCDFFGQRFSLSGSVDGSLVRFGGTDLGLDRLVTFDRAQPGFALLVGRLARGSECLALGDVLRRCRLHLLGQILGLRRGLRLDICAAGELGCRVCVLVARDLGRSDHTRRGGDRRQLLAQRRRPADSSGVLAAQRRRIFAALGRDHDVDDRADEHERRRERVHPDARDEGGGVAAHQLDPEAADAVTRDVQREQPAVTDA